MTPIPYLLTVLVLALQCQVHAQLKTPKAFLGYEPGERFTPHHRVYDYFSHVSSELSNAELFNYGTTYEHRPLAYLVITSQENFDRLEQIRVDHLRSAGVEDGVSQLQNIALVWLSYNVHGNEASSMEAAMKTLYALADRSNADTQEWLRNTVVIIDPCLNPDGRDRYANFYAQYGSEPPNVAADAFEHYEPWPGGRTNHYFFDLNRDWAWATQRESRQRLNVYNAWLPHLHVDFHEQGHNNPYFFAPAAEPMHEVISDWQREFQITIGKNNARYFDEKGWLYFTKEVFDLYYPSYGDTYPTYSGAIGMTYEQAGGGFAGLAITTENGDPLTLHDRILHHHTSALSTVEVASKNAQRLNQEFRKYFEENNLRPASTYKGYLIRATNGRDKIKPLTDWLQLHGIRFGHPAPAKNVKGFDFRTRKPVAITISSHDIVIDAFQPKSRFITAIFEPTSTLPDSMTYDITAWNLIYAHDLDAVALTERTKTDAPYSTQSAPQEATSSEKPYAYIFRYEGIDDAKFLSALLQADVRVRVAERSFRVDENTFSPGTLIITRRENEAVHNLDGLIRQLALSTSRQVFTAHSGFVDEGRDLGSNDLSYLKMPQVAVLFGEFTSPLSAGEVWHFFEQELHFPVTHLGTSYFDNIDLSSYDIFIIPEGKYKSFLDEGRLEKLSAWVTSGGRLILLAGALESFVDVKGFGLKRYRSELEKNRLEAPESDPARQTNFVRYDETDRKQLSSNISGAIYEVNVDPSHPLAFGMRDKYYTLKTHGRRFAPLAGGWNVAYFGSNVKPIQGFAGYRANQALTESLLLGMEQKGQGQVVYFADNPLFRNFWERGKLLFSNAIFMGH